MAEVGWGGAVDWWMESRQDSIKRQAVRRGGAWGWGGHVALLQGRMLLAWSGWWPSKWREEGAFYIL